MFVNTWYLLQGGKIQYPGKKQKMEVFLTYGDINQPLWNLNVLSNLLRII